MNYDKDYLNGRNLILKHKELVFFLIQILILQVGSTQDFESLPKLSSDLDSWSSSIAHNINEPILRGTYFYKTDDQMITPEQNPFFKESWDRNGAVTYEGRHYNNIGIIYNASEDLLLIWSLEMRKNGQKSLLINQSKVDSFTVHSQKFLNYKYAEIGTKGFYRKVMQGKNVSCFSKFTKKGNLEELDYVYEEKSQYWIKHQGIVLDYKNISSLSKIFPDYKKQIRKYANENRRISRRDKERFLLLMLYYCDTIVK